MHAAGAWAADDACDAGRLLVLDAGPLLHY